ncbi:hypothetical protein LO763_05160 [Glycomyces sp. A-F 0318]|uniref:hypothetical protein n=1 Tax=Glycomyces amatae TaxID=2881355 RepID=UPI001E2AB5AE|nr:hypothetical protein [Glycomyces amatae]MCD0443014.1 hypothetical protein [Glycomyces amatae]
MGDGGDGGDAADFGADLPVEFPSDVVMAAAGDGGREDVIVIDGHVIGDAPVRRADEVVVEMTWTAPDERSGP